jgi:hypothetical protein
LEITVTVDPTLNRFVVQWYGSEIMINHFVAGHGPAVVTTSATAPGSALPVVTIANVPTNPTNMGLCRSLQPGR